VKTKPTIKARCVYKIGQRQGQQQGQQRYDSTLPAWSNVSTSFVSTDQTQPQETSPRATNLSDADIDIETNSTQTSTNTSSILTPVTAEISDDKIRKTVEETIEISLHKFMAEQMRLQSQQVVVRQMESNQHAQRLDAIERLIMTMAARQDNVPIEKQIDHKSDNSSRSDLTPSKSLDLRRIALGQDEVEHDSPSGDKKSKSKKQKLSSTTKGVQNVPATPTQVGGPANTEASESESLTEATKPTRKPVKPIVQQTLKTIPKNPSETIVNTRSRGQQKPQTSPPKTFEDKPEINQTHSAP
jgi:hypothetical protein